VPSNSKHLIWVAELAGEASQDSA